MVIMTETLFYKEIVLYCLHQQIKVKTSNTDVTMYVELNWYVVTVQTTQYLQGALTYVHENKFHM